MNVPKANCNHCINRIDIANFSEKLYVRLARDIVNRQVFDEWMLRYHVNLKGSLILQILYNLEWTDSDVDFCIPGEYFEEAIRYLPKVFIDGEAKPRSLFPIAAKHLFYYGARIEIVSDSTWLADVFHGNYAFSQNTWNPKTGLIIFSRRAIESKTSMCDVYSEIVARVKTGHHPHNAATRIMMRIAKYMSRGIMINY